LPREEELREGLSKKEKTKPLHKSGFVFCSELLLMIKGAAPGRKGGVSFYEVGWARLR
jgi:hypothetical protein